MIKTPAHKSTRKTPDNIRRGHLDIHSLLPGPDIEWLGLPGLRQEAELEKAVPTPVSGWNGTYTVLCRAGQERAPMLPEHML